MMSNAEKQKPVFSRIRDPWRPRFTLPAVPLPPTRRLLFYGYAIPDGWLQEYALKHEHLLQARTHFRRNNANLANFAIRLLVSQTGVSTLTWEYALATKVLPPDVVVGEDNEVNVLAICATDEDSLIDRPSQEQVDKLQQIMGSRQPMWWVDHEPSDD
ncbi:hypothetical protein BV25DRAFT_1826580 [Artomyces pyxidatus]|uniref:Uncharacterized protein n=1 Tax=Artomyces pyxidatus TaxID=48021 RepID=A0ACB8SY74_9AGAM|nr:hypothetical protein BV25DRAFT_1826580 [Artomyces pyxidatus]